MIYAHKGEWMTCENGHRLAQMARNVLHGQIQCPAEDMENWQIAPVRQGSQPLCPICGARFQRIKILDDGRPFSLGATQTHFENGGWR